MRSHWPPPRDRIITLQSRTFFAMFASGLTKPLLRQRGELLHKGAGTGKREDDLLVVVDVLVRERAAFPVLQPFPRGLVAADEEVPRIFRHVVEVLRVVDVHTAIGIVANIANVASSNVASFQLGIGIGCWQHFHIGNNILAGDGEVRRAVALARRGLHPGRHSIVNCLCCNKKQQGLSISQGLQVSLH